MDWERIGKTVTKDGTTNVYEAVGTGYRIESRKKDHLNASGGTWAFTSFHVLLDGEEVARGHSLKAAKEQAEMHRRGEA